MNLAKTSATFIATALAVLVLSSCGWTPRGVTHDLPPDKSFAIVAKRGDSRVATLVGRLMAQYNIRVATDISAADYQVVILSEDSKLRTASLNARARVAEYQVIYEAKAQLFDRDGALLMETDDLESSQFYEFDENDALASQNERVRVENLALNSLANQILRALDQHFNANSP